MAWLQLKKSCLVSIFVGRTADGTFSSGQTRTLRLLSIDTVATVLQSFNLRMTGIRFHSHDLCREGLVDENLTRFHNAAVVDRAVHSHTPIGVDLGVDVKGSIYIEAGDDGFEARCS